MEFQVCSRCNGTGRYSYNLKDGSTCYGCGGSGKVSKLPEKTAKTMKLLCNTEEWKKYTFKNGEELKAKFVSLSDKTQEPIYMVSNKYGTGFKFKLSSIQKNCIIL
jgi:hypothetical protein